MVTDHPHLCHLLVTAYWHTFTGVVKHCGTSNESGSGSKQGHLAILHFSSGMKDCGVVDELNVPRLQPLRQVELRALSNGSYSPNTHM